MKTTAIIFAIAAALILAVQFTTSTPKPSTAAVYSVETVTKKAEGMAHDFTWKQGGKTVSFSEYTRGKTVLLNFWATWCSPCRREMPDLVAISKEMADKDVVVVGVSLDQADNAGALVQNFADKYGIPFPTIVDSKARIADAYGGMPSIPTTILIDKNGRVAQKIVGMQSRIQFESALKRIM